MIKEIIIQYDHIDNTVRILENDFTTFESLGVLEAAKAMIQKDWLEGENDIDAKNC
jgi:hypothetical protein